MRYSELQYAVRTNLYDRLVKAAQGHRIFLSCSETPNGFLPSGAQPDDVRSTYRELVNGDDAQIQAILDLEAFAESTAPVAERATALRLFCEVRVVWGLSKAPALTRRVLTIGETSAAFLSPTRDRPAAALLRAARDSHVLKGFTHGRERRNSPGEIYLVQSRSHRRAGTRFQLHHRHRGLGGRPEINGEVLNHFFRGMQRSLDPTLLVRVRLATTTDAGMRVADASTHLGISDPRFPEVIPVSYTVIRPPIRHASENRLRD